MIYLDTSALLKQLVEEEQSGALDTYLRAEPGIAFTSLLAEVELPLTLGRGGLDPALGPELLRYLAMVDLTPAIRQLAAGYGPLGLRTLDAIHVATAVELTAATGIDIDITVVTYDHRMVAGCAELGLPSLSPGVSN